MTAAAGGNRRKSKKELLAEVTTRSGLFSVRSQAKPYVRVREEKKAGSNLILDFTDPRSGERQKETLDFGVRDDRGHIDEERWARAQARADDRSAALRLSRERTLAEPAKITLGRAYEMFFDPEHGGLLSVSASYTASHRRARDFWKREFGAAHPWNQITPAKLEAAADRAKVEFGPAAAEQFVERLQIVWGWLTEKAEIEGLKNPARKWDRKAFRGGRQPRRPRYSEAELVALIAVSRRVDPRFRLLLCFADSSGSRGGQIRTAWRSALNAPLAVPPEPDEAPHGWIVFGGVKGQADHRVFLTSWQREELAGAMGGYFDDSAGAFKPGFLSVLEARFLETGDDYPLFPGGYLRKGVAPIRAEGLRRTLRPVGRTEPWNWLVEAERLADVARVRGRGLHGIRRAWAKYSRREIGKTAAARAGGWSKEETLEDIYAGERHEDLVASREAQERRRPGGRGRGPAPAEPTESREEVEARVEFVRQHHLPGELAPLFVGAPYIADRLAIVSGDGRYVLRYDFGLKRVVLLDLLPDAAQGGAPGARADENSPDL